MEKFESKFEELKDGLDLNEVQSKESVIMSFFKVWFLRYIIFKKLVIDHLTKILNIFWEYLIATNSLSLE